jgi:hypothetical protein
MRITPAQNDALQMLAALATLIFMSWSLKYWPAFYHLDCMIRYLIGKTVPFGAAWLGLVSLSSRSAMRLS